MSDEPKILVTGGSGKLATAIRQEFKCICPPKQELDVTNYHQVVQYLRNHKNIEYIIHAGAITSVELCENDKKLAYDVNVNGTKNVIEAINDQLMFDERRIIKLIYISTPCIFKGNIKEYDEHYDEDSLPQPENYYGLTKAISEELIRSSHIPYVIIRANFVAKEKWPYPKAFVDRFGTYLYAEDVARAMKYHIKNSEGIVHIVGNKTLSMFDLAKLTTPEVKAMTMNDYKGKAKLTVNMCMATKRWTPMEISKP